MGLKKRRNTETRSTKNSLVLGEICRALNSLRKRVQIPCFYSPRTPLVCSDWIAGQWQRQKIRDVRFLPALWPVLCGNRIGKTRAQSTSNKHETQLKLYGLLDHSSERFPRRSRWKICNNVDNIRLAVFYDPATWGRIGTRRSPFLEGFVYGRKVSRELFRSKFILQQTIKSVDCLDLVNVSEDVGKFYDTGGWLNERLNTGRVYTAYIRPVPRRHDLNRGILRPIFNNYLPFD